MMNHFDGFRLFHEKEEKRERPDQYISTIKKQVHVPKKLWMGMPVILSNVKIGELTIRDPKVFYVTEFDNVTVTIKNVPNPMNTTDEDDPDDEVNKDDNDFIEDTFTIPRKDFEKLLEPPQGDYATASASVQWRQGP